CSTSPSVARSSRHDRAASHVENHPGDPGTLIRGEEERGTRDIFWQTEAPNRVELDELLLLSLRDALTIATGENRFRRDAVHANTDGTPLGGALLREDLYTRLCRGVRNRAVWMRPAPRGRGNGDDAAGPPLLHRRQHALDGKKRGRQIALDGGAPSVLTDLFQRSGHREAAAGIGDDDVDWSERSFDVPSHGLEVVEFRDLGNH